MTFSIVARGDAARCYGVAVASSSPAVAARCAHARAAAGAVATQNITDPALGPTILAGLAGGAAAGDVLESALRATPFSAYRQVLAVGPYGAPVVHSGAHTLARSAFAVGRDAAAAGNLLANDGVPHAMLAAFETTAGPLASRLLAALLAGAAQGGEAGPLHSAGMLVVRDVSWPIVDLRVDWSDGDPVHDLERIWAIYSPQVEEYVRRALDPAGAAAFGVPGDP